METSDSRRGGATRAARPAEQRHSRHREVSEGSRGGLILGSPGAGGFRAPLLFLNRGAARGLSKGATYMGVMGGCG
jgi:hypothetical protein